MGNGSIENYECGLVETGTRQVEDWKDLGEGVLSKGEITIGIFTDVKEGDYVEWIPTLFGERIIEWASFVGMTLGERYNTDFGNTEDTLNDGQFVAETFEVGVTGPATSFTIQGVSLFIRKLNGPPDLQVHICNVNATDAPDSGSCLSSNTTMAVSQIPAATGWINVSMPETTLSLGGIYALILNTTAGGVDKFLTNSNHTGANYTGGSMWYSYDTGVAWDNLTYDLKFELRGISTIVAEVNVTLLSPANIATISSSV
ncbi:unnamed protein product, partial [marine sediment metagenome]